MEGCRARRNIAMVRVFAFASWPAKRKEKVLPLIAGEGRCAWERRSTEKSMNVQWTRFVGACEPRRFDCLVVCFSSWLLIVTSFCSSER